jgi:hypothetical protein
MSKSSKDISHLPTLGSNNYAFWHQKMNTYLCFHNLFDLVHGTEPRPTDAIQQANWDKRATWAAGTIEMTLDDKNATHFEGIEGDPILMWQKLDTIHNNKTPGMHFISKSS